MFEFVGPNGAAKTTAMRITLRVAEADACEIRWHGQQMNDELRNCVGHMLQDLQLSPKQRRFDMARPIVGGPVGPLALQAFLAALQEVVAPGREPVRLHSKLSGELLERLAAQQPQHGLHLLARRAPGPRPIVTGLLVWFSLFTAMTGIFTPAYPVSKGAGSDGPSTERLEPASC